MPYTTATPILVDASRVRLRFTGAGETPVEDDFPLRNVKESARARIAQLNAARSESPQIVVGQPLDLTVPPPTAEQAKAAELAADRATFRQLKQDVDDGIIQPNDAAYIALRDKIKAAVRP